MTVLERIQELCKIRNTNVSKLEIELQLGKGTLYKWGKSAPNSDKLEKVADYFNVSVDYLLGRTEQLTTLSEKDEKDIAKEIEKLREKLKLSEGLMFDGEPASEEAIESVLDAMSFGVRQAKIINRKYTPKKYLDGGDVDDKSQD